MDAVRSGFRFGADPERDGTVDRTADARAFADDGFANLDLVRPIDTILHPTDFSPCAQQALAHARLLAERSGAELHLLHAVVLPPPGEAPTGVLGDPEQLYRRLEELGSSRLEALAGEIEPTAPSRRLALRRGLYAGPVILDYAREVGAGLVVLGTHGYRGSIRFLLGSVADEVLRYADCPVLTVRESSESSVTPAVRRILVAVDLSPLSRDTLEWGREMALAYGAELDLLHVVERPPSPPPYPPTAALVQMEEVSGEIDQRCREALEALRGDTLGRDVAAAVHVAHGRTPSEILAFARQHGSGLIVLGSHGMTGLKSILLGTTAEAVARSAECPVLTVPLLERGSASAAG